MSFPLSLYWFLLNVRFLWILFKEYLESFSPRLLIYKFYSKKLFNLWRFLWKFNVLACLVQCESVQHQHRTLKVKDIVVVATMDKFSSSSYYWSHYLLYIVYILVCCLLDRNRSFDFKPNMESFCDPSLEITIFVLLDTLYRKYISVTHMLDKTNTVKFPLLECYWFSLYIITSDIRHHVNLLQWWDWFKLRAFGITI